MDDTSAATASERPERGLSACVTAAAASSGDADSCAWMHDANWSTSLLDTSWTTPGRPSWATWPEKCRSVSMCTRVPPPSIPVSCEATVPSAPPFPRVSRPLTASVTLRAASSRSTSFTSTRNCIPTGPSLTPISAFQVLSSTTSLSFAPGMHGIDPLGVEEDVERLVGRGRDLELVLELHEPLLPGSSADHPGAPDFASNVARGLQSPGHALRETDRRRRRRERSTVLRPGGMMTTSTMRRCRVLAATAVAALTLGGGGALLAATSHTTDGSRHAEGLDRGARAEGRRCGVRVLQRDPEGQAAPLDPPLLEAQLRSPRARTSTRAPRGKTGPVVVVLCGTTCRSGMSGTATLSAKFLAAMRAGRTYVNVHTTKNPSGEIRGQVKLTTK